jgi:hypothetical protein
MSDENQQRLDKVQNQIRRICGHEDMSDKQFESFRKLVQEQVALTGGVEELKEIFK